MPKVYPELQSWLPAAQSAVTDHLSRFVRALAADRPTSDPEAWASAVPVVLAGRPMLLTAKHAIDGLDGRRLLVETPSHFVPLLLDSSCRADSEELDVTAISLPASALNWGFDFLDLEVQHEPEISSSEVEIFIAMGFPWRETAASKVDLQLELRVVSYWTFEAKEAYAALGLSPTNWVLTKFDRERAYQAGYPRAMKKPHGMSGGPLWRFWGPSDSMPSLARGAFAGILVEYRKGSVKCMLSARLNPVRAVARKLL